MENLEQTIETTNVKYSNYIEGPDGQHFYLGLLTDDMTPFLNYQNEHGIKPKDKSMMIDLENVDKERLEYIMDEYKANGELSDESQAYIAEIFDANQDKYEHVLKPIGLDYNDTDALGGVTIDKAIEAYHKRDTELVYNN